MLKNLTTIIIVKNEETMLPDCLKSVDFSGEILVIDTGSIDRTVEIAKKAGARMIKSKASNYSEWRNVGLENAKTDWIFYIDADERVDSELKHEIEKIVNSNFSKYNAYAIPRKNIILGQEFKHGGQWPDYVKRLFRRNSLKRWTGKLHEEPSFTGQMGHLRYPLTHIKHEDFREMVEKTNIWSEVEAKLMLDAKHPPMNVFRFASAMFREFWKRMIVQLAFLDGPKGIMYAMYQVFSKFISYAKLWEMQMKRGIVS